MGQSVAWDDGVRHVGGLVPLGLTLVCQLVAFYCYDFQGGVCFIF